MAAVDDRIIFVVSVDDLVIGGGKPWLEEEFNVAFAGSLCSWALSMAVDTEAGAEEPLARVVNLKVTLLVEIGVCCLIAFPAIWLEDFAGHMLLFDPAAHVADWVEVRKAWYLVADNWGLGGDFTAKDFVHHLKV